jgi:hypothetical protein
VIIGAPLLLLSKRVGQVLADRKFKRPFCATPPAPPAPACPAAGPAAPWALACRPVRRPRPPGRPAARRHAGAHGLDRPRCLPKGILHALQRRGYTRKGVRDTSAARTSPPKA